jgi:hypothetical protein
MVSRGERSLAVTGDGADCPMNRGGLEALGSEKLAPGDRAAVVEEFDGRLVAHHRPDRLALLRLDASGEAVLAGALGDAALGVSSDIRN